MFKNLSDGQLVFEIMVAQEKLEMLLKEADRRK